MRAMVTPRPSAPAPVRWLVRGLLAAYFEHIERFRAERIPATGPLLVVANHPGSFTDAFIIGASIGRPVHFVATVQVFRSKPIAWLLTRCGVIPINRQQDDPGKMATVAQTFDACGAVLEEGGAVGLFPEGVTYDDSQLKELKTGAARLSLGLEAKHEGRLGLHILPVGLTYSAKERFRSRVLVHVGDPVLVGDWLAAHDADRKRAARSLTDVIDRQIRSLILDIPALEHQRIVASVRRLYLERLRAANLIVTEPLPTDAETLVLTQAIARALKHAEQAEPERLPAFVGDLDRYERLITRLRLSDRIVGDVTAPGSARSRLAAGAAMIAAAPIALFGWAHHLVPSQLVAWAVKTFTPADRRKSQTPLTVMLSGLAAVGICYAIYVGAAYTWLGARAAAVYAVSLPVSGLASHAYFRALWRQGGRWRAAGLLFQRPIARRTIVLLRSRLIDRIEAFRADYARVLVPELGDVVASHHRADLPG
jgi:1-acyl-sn-glycerol-3-phosphate acyltransferase